MKLPNCRRAARKASASLKRSAARLEVGEFRVKAPALEWIEGDLATLDTDTAPGPFAAAVLASADFFIILCVCVRREHPVAVVLASRSNSSR